MEWAPMLWGMVKWLGAAVPAAILAIFCFIFLFLQFKVQKGPAAILELPLAERQKRIAGRQFFLVFV